MLETLITHRTLLEQMRVTTRGIDPQLLSIGMRLTLNIYVQILDDGLAVLNSLIRFLSPR